MRSRLPAKLLGIGLLAASAGCGPVEYVREVTGRASSAVADARRANAEVLAPYEFTIAVENLERARELAGYSRYHDAIDFGKKAADFAFKARDTAREKSAKPKESAE